MPAKNLVMFSIDDMRAVNSWGHFTPLVATPNMDRLADMGTTFEHAITQVPLCNPARTSVLTGQQPSRTGVLDNDMPWFERVSAADTLPAVLKAAGAHVAMYGKHFHTHVVPSQAQATMFDEYIAPTIDTNASQVINDDVRHDTPFAVGRYAPPYTSLQDERTANAAVNFLTRTAEGLAEPFFLGVGISRPHLNWWAPAQFFDMYDPADIRAALVRSLEDGTIIPGNGEYFDVPPMTRPNSVHRQIAADMDLWVDYIHGYLAGISYADAKVGQVLDALAANPALAADTSILLWSDHGYHLGDKDRWGKFDHWKEATEVPFIVVDPDAPGGRTAQQIVSLVDIFPTVLDLMGLAAPARLPLSGDSLLPLVRNPDAGWYDPGSGKGVALTTVYGSASVRADVPGVGDLRYTRYPDGTEELYDLDADPNEHVNRVDYATGRGLTPADNTLRDLMSGLMDRQLAQNGVLMSDGANPVTGTAADELLVSSSGFGTNVLSGGGGDDTYVLHRASTINEAADGGTDMVVIRDGALEPSFALPTGVEMMQVVNNGTGNAAANRIFGTAFSNTLNGAGGNDVLDGFAGVDRLNGGDGNDLLRGYNGNDVITGGLGADTLDGSSNNDTFDFNAEAESGPTASDTIVNFNGAGATAGDRIDLAGVDANVGVAGDQAFRFGGSGAGQLRITESGGVSTVLGNTDADATAEVRIVIRDGAVTASAYVAEDFAL